MKRKYVGDVSKRYTVFKHVSQWDGNFRCDVWELIFQSNDKNESLEFYHAQNSDYYQLNDESLETCKTLSETC